MSHHQIAPELEPLATPCHDLQRLPDAINPRKGDVAAIARSYDEFGQLKPIVVWSGSTNGEHPDLDGKLIVIDGNHQFTAASQHLNWTHIAVTNLTDTMNWVEAKAYALAANRTGQMGMMDDNAVAALLADVRDNGSAALLAATAYDELDLERLFRDDDGPAGGGPGDAPDGFGEFDVDDLDLEHQCPKCGFEWSSS